MPALAGPTQELIRSLIREGWNNTEISTRTGAARNTIRAIRAGMGAAGNPAPAAADLPRAKHETAGPDLPGAILAEYVPFVIDTPGVWLVLGDVHLPYHDRPTLELAVGEAKRRNAVGVILNGDLLDSHEISTHDKDPSAPRYVEEIEVARKFLAWARGQFPRGRVVFKEGNHEERLSRYILNRAPALFGLDGLDLPSLVKLADVGGEFVGDRRVIGLGRLNIVHGHEYPGGAASPVNPARGLYLKARSVALCGHHHQTSEHHARNIRGKAEAAWSVGCACFLSPRYSPLNNWNLGYAMVDVSTDGTFGVENRRVFGGRTV